MRALMEYTLAGTAADGQTWSVSGNVFMGSDGEFPAAIDAAMRDAFAGLTQGRAVYGNPGIGCRGPYKINKFTLERVVSDEPS